MRQNGGSMCNNKAQSDGALIERNIECGRESVIIFASN